VPTRSRVESILDLEGRLTLDFLATRSRVGSILDLESRLTLDFLATRRRIGSCIILEGSFTLALCNALVCRSSLSCGWLAAAIIRSVLTRVTPTRRILLLCSLCHGLTIGMHTRTPLANAVIFR
jgi:hypothetical protein